MKNKIRNTFIAKRKNLSKKDINSNEIIKTLYKLSEYQKSKSIMSYVSLEEEVNTRNLIKKIIDTPGKIALVPYMEDNKIKISQISSFNILTEGTFGILEPKIKTKYTDSIDLIIIPGIAFDKKGSRIGFGNAYYDKFLIKHPSSKKIGLAFDEQIIDIIPTESHDIAVDLIITENQIIRCNNG